VMRPLDLVRLWLQMIEIQINSSYVIAPSIHLPSM
jgi:hypothetical protein